MKRFVLFALTALLLAGCFHFDYVRAQASSSSANSDLEKPIRDYDNQIASWEREANLEILFVIAIIVFGPFIALFQKWSSPWAKTATIVLGIATSILTGINSQIFSADYRALRSAASEGKAITAQLQALLVILNDPRTTEANRITTQGLYLAELAKFPAVIAKLQGNSEGQATTSENRQEALFQLPRVYAESTPALPAWVKTLPSDDYSLYFRGEAHDASLSDAKTDSLNDAYNQALKALKEKAPQAADTNILALIKASAIVQDSAFVSDSNGTGYVYYTLLRLAKQIEDIGLKSLPMPSQPALIIFKGKNWRPSDLSFNSSSGLFALDPDGGVSRLAIGGQQGGQITTLFRVQRAYSAYAIAASADAVYVAANSQLGCTVFKYSLTDKTTSRRVMNVKQRCVGIATDGTTLYLSMPDQQEVNYWSDWKAASFQRWALPNMDQPGSMVFDQMGNRVIVAGTSGKGYAISIPDGKQQVLASNLGAVTSIAASRLHLLFGSGKKVLFLARSDNSGENPPANLSLTGGHIVGVAVDGGDNLWFADYESSLVEGPFPLN